MTAEAPSTSPAVPATATRMREVMGRFCTGIAVVTGLDSDGNRVGFTCQSLTSLSLEPPLISISPARSSTSWPLIRSTGSFCVNVLGQAQQEVSNAFARSGGDKFHGLTLDGVGQNGVPHIAGALSWIDCAIEAEYEAGDHTLVVGRVLDLDARLEERPLLYYAGRYSHLA